MTLISAEYLEMGIRFASEDTTKHALARRDLVVSELLGSGYGGRKTKPKLTT